ncbi:unnamed protein product [Adineta ricciae]|uniref:Alpha/beta hydrolase domain-containing protein n=1 Tax=Adineta ricciae TaxID=249248 RepID=A0A814QNV1_ADIRI|nr:unnamed protein product [Adineta ricciae]
MQYEQEPILLEPREHFGIVKSQSKQQHQTWYSTKVRSIWITVLLMLCIISGIMVAYHSYSKNKVGKTVLELKSYTRARYKPELPKNIGYMDIYIRKPTSDGSLQPFRRFHFPAVCYRHRDFPLSGRFINPMPWTNIYFERRSRQTVIYSSKGNVCVLPSLINDYDEIYSVAELIAAGYASLARSGGKPLRAIDVTFYFKSMPLTDPDVPQVDDFTGVFNDRVYTRYGSFPSGKRKDHVGIYSTTESEDEDIYDPSRNYYYRSRKPYSQYTKTGITRVTTTTTLTTTSEPVRTGITKIVINPTTNAIAPSENPTFGGTTFGTVGMYEKLRGIAYGQLDPYDIHNSIITDLKLAPRNKNGMVEYSTDFYILKPVNLTNGNHKLFFEVNNRGGKLFGSFAQSSGGNNPTTASDAGQAFLMNQGYTMAWCGWDPLTHNAPTDITMQYEQEPILLEPREHFGIVKSQSKQQHQTWHSAKVRNIWITVLLMLCIISGIIVAYHSYSKNKVGETVLELKSYTRYKPELPKNIGYMNIYIRKPTSDSSLQPFRRFHFPAVCYRHRDFPLSGRFINLMPWTNIYFERRSRQTIIYSSKGNVCVLPSLINDYDEIYSVAELIAAGYASLARSGGKPLRAIDVTFYFKPTPLTGPDVPQVDDFTGAFDDGVYTRYGSFLTGKRKDHVGIYSTIESEDEDIYDSSRNHYYRSRKPHSQHTKTDITRVTTLTTTSEPVHTGITKIVINPTTNAIAPSENPTFGGTTFGTVGMYEKVRGIAYGQLDPYDIHNSIITDLKLAPRNKNGMVEYSTDFYILKPVNLTNGNHKLFFEVNNRGSKLFGSFAQSSGGNNPTTASDAGQAFLMNQGYTMAWCGWDPNGMVEYSTDFYILKPVNLTNGNHKLFFEVNNRGGKLFGSFAQSSGGNNPTTASDAGQAFLMNQGYTMAWCGWDPSVSPTGSPDLLRIYLPIVTNADDTSITGPGYEYIVLDNSVTTSYMTAYRTVSTDTTKAKLTVKDHLTDAPITISPTDWMWTSDNTISLLPLNTTFKQSSIYELVYTAKDPYVAGIGFAATRDFVSFLRSSRGDNPLAGDVTRVLSWSLSQPARYMNDFIWLGFNEDLEKKHVFDGVFNWIGAGNGIGLNYRFAQSARTERNRQNHLYPEAPFPFSYTTLTDSGMHKTDGRNMRCTKTNTCPKIMNIISSNEYWVKAGSLLHSSIEGYDIPTPSNVHNYLISGTQHGGAAAANSRGICQQFGNTVDANPVLRALYVALDQWIDGTNPPASRVPNHSDKTAVLSSTTENSHLGIGIISQTALNWPTIPNVLYTGLVTVRNRFDFGPKFSRGIITIAPPKSVGVYYSSFVSKLDADGNELAGIRLPPVSVPVATYTGWNLRSAAFGGNDGCESTGSTIPFAPDKATRMAKGDSRLSLTERYGTRSNYEKAVAAAANELAKQRLLLPADVQAYITASQQTIQVINSPTYGNYTCNYEKAVAAAANELAKQRLLLPADVQAYITASQQTIQVINSPTYGNYTW